MASIVINSIKQRLKSGDNVSPVTDKNQDGNTNSGNQMVDSAPNQNDGKTDLIPGKDVCKSCETSWDLCKPKISCVQCCMCKLYVCLGVNCANMTKENLKFINRDDVYWVCFQCKVSNAGPDTITPTVGTEKFLSTVTNMVGIKIKETLKDVLDFGEENVDEGVWKNPNVDGVEDYTPSEDEFPQVPFKIKMSKREQREARSAANTVQMMKKAANELKVDELRKNNVIIHRLAEDLNGSKEARSKEKKAVSDLLKTLNIQDKPTGIMRLGKFNKDTAAESPRPLKVMFGNVETRDKIMSNANMLAHCTIDDLQGIQICYDMSMEDRKIQKDLISKAHDLSKNSTEFDWKVRGPPGAMKLRQFKKRETHKKMPPRQKPVTVEETEGIHQEETRTMTEEAHQEKTREETTETPEGPQAAAAAAAEGQT